MKIAQVGNWFKGFTQVDFFSEQTFLEYDALIIDMSIIAGGSGHNGHAFLETRKKNLQEFISFKKIPIIYLAPEQDQFAVRNNRNTIDFVPANNILPMSAYETMAEIGRNLIIIPKTPFSQFIEKYKSWFGYRRFYNKFMGTPIACTPYTKKVLAFYTEDAVVLPKIEAFDHAQQEEFFSELLECTKRIRFDSNANPLPNWTESYFLPGEYEAKEKISQLNEQIKELKSGVENEKAKIEIITEKKRLFTASGDELELKVEAIFRELGFKILEAERNRDDLIVKYDNDIAVIEIKGLNHSAGEKNAAQLEKWRASYLEAHGVNPKGILLVNTYRDMPLADRNQPDFPDQMLRYSVGREHCLISTLQLMALYFEVIRNPESKETLIKSLFDTVGCYPDYYKWQNYITQG